MLIVFGRTENPKRELHADFEISLIKIVRSAELCGL